MDEITYLNTLKAKGIEPAIGEQEIVFDNVKDRAKRLAAGNTVLKKIFFTEWGNNMSTDGVHVYQVKNPGGVGGAEEALPFQRVAVKVLDIETPFRDEINGKIADMVTAKTIICGVIVGAVDEEGKLAVAILEKIVEAKLLEEKNRAHLVDDVLTFTPYKVDAP